PSPSAGCERRKQVFSHPRSGIRQAPATADALPVEGVPVWRGKFDVAQAERLLWRAGFGPRPGEAQKLARLGREGAHAPETGAEGPRPQADASGPREPRRAPATRREGPTARTLRRVGPRPR